MKKVRDSSFRVGSGRRSGLRFDAENGVVTEALIFLGQLDPERIGDALEDATHYEPTPLAQFNEMLRALAIDLSAYTFVDIGAGMGRIVLLASLNPFKQIIGVEVSPALCQTARDNVVRWRARHPSLPCSDIRIVEKDAAAFRMPRGETVFYLYNPFGGDTLARILDRIARESTGTAYLMYHTPVHRHLLDQDSRYALVRDLGYGLIYRRSAA